jgi:hypothetical protein
MMFPTGKGIRADFPDRIGKLGPQNQAGKSVIGSEARFENC